MLRFCQKSFKFFYLTLSSLLFLSCGFSQNIVAQQNEISVLTPSAPLDFPQLNNERIKQKFLFYQKLADRSKRFRTAVYISGAVATIGLLTYLGFKFFGTKKETTDKGSPAVPPNSSKAPSVPVFKKNHNFPNFGQRCNYYFQKGIGKGFYYGISAIIISSFLGLQSNLFTILKDKFIELWNGQNKEAFFGSVKLLHVNLKQLNVLFDSWNLLGEERETQENYTMFIDCLENLIAIVWQRATELLPPDSQVQKSILNLIDLLSTSVLEFSEKLQKSLSLQSETGEKAALSNDQIEVIKNSFEKLCNQIVRFVTLCNAAVYEA